MNLRRLCRIPLSQRVPSRDLSTVHLTATIRGSRFGVHVAEDHQGVGGRGQAVRVRAVQRGEQRDLRDRKTGTARLGGFGRRQQPVGRGRRCDLGGEHPKGSKPTWSNAIYACIMTRTPELAFK